MYVVLDSNVWLSELGLRSAKGVATRFYIKQNDIQLVLPEVIKEEVERNILNSLTKYSEDIQRNHRQMLALFGELKEVVLPNQDQIQDIASSTFNDVGVPLLEIPFSLKNAKASLRKINDKVPPNDKNQQFKDGVIWADCIDLLEKDDVVLVTEDKAFFKDRDYRRGLASNLMSEVESSANSFTLYSSLSELITNLKSDVVVDQKSLVKQFTAQISDSMNSILNRNEFSVSSEEYVEITPYLTGNIDKLYIEFTIIFNCEDSSEQNRKDGKLTLKGDGSYNISDHSFSELRNLGEELTYIDEEGEQQNKNQVIAIGSVVIGHKTVKHTVKYKVD